MNLQLCQLCFMWSQSYMWFQHVLFIDSSALVVVSVRCDVCKMSWVVVLNPNIVIIKCWLKFYNISQFWILRHKYCLWNDKHIRGGDQRLCVYNLSSIKCISSFLLLHFLVEQSSGVVPGAFSNQWMASMWHGSAQSLISLPWQPCLIITVPGQWVFLSTAGQTGTESIGVGMWEKNWGCHQTATLRSWRGICA